MMTWRKLVAMITWRRLVAVGIAAAVGSGVVLDDALGSSGTPRRVSAADVQTINAATDPGAAAGELNDFCAQLQNCKFVGTDPITTSYSAPRIVGDALYNCGQAYAEDSVKISDERSQSTTLEESLSTKVSVSLLGLVTQSIEAEVNSKQLEEVSTTTSNTSAVVVPPGWVGWTQTQVSTLYATGTVQITDGPHLVDITNFKASYPGWVSPGQQGLVWTTVKGPMSDDPNSPLYQAEHGDLLTLSAACNGLTTAPSLLGSGPGAASHHPTDSVRVTTCGLGKPREHGGRRPTVDCSTREAAGTFPPLDSKVTVTLARGRRTYARGIATPRYARVDLIRARRIPAGRYTLMLERPHEMTVIPVTLS